MCSTLRTPITANISKSFVKDNNWDWKMIINQLRVEFLLIPPATGCNFFFIPTLYEFYNGNLGFLLRKSWNCLLSDNCRFLDLSRWRICALLVVAKKISWSVAKNIVFCIRKCCVSNGKIVKKVCKLVSQVSPMVNLLNVSISVWNFMPSLRLHKFHIHSMFFTVRKKLSSEE